MGFKIDKMWAFVAVHDDGDEGIMGAGIGPGGSVMPLVAADLERIESLKPVAVQIAKMTGVEAKLVRFDNMTVEGTLTGRGFVPASEVTTDTPQ